ncbi:PREDICTED: uncharacterized protein LOC109474755 [Branchiostoma belcheri]|uniref:Uncharacterized protein LOC109474755 n=1 Tax=Branchiostoma belcheri TaxID=7741 RepID=A0A6P4YMI2_BRABE|nr:PREDICTED: uncharacterized protein LOC109474755 [Branchiostoma belcheri]
MATTSWAQQFTCKWVDDGRLDMSGFPEDAPACLTLYLTSIRSEEWNAVLEMIENGEGHCSANETGILFSEDYESSSESSSEEEEEQGPLPEDEVAFFAGCFPKDRVKKTVFLGIMETCLEERRKQCTTCKCLDLDCEKQFLDYVHRETKSKGATDQEITCQESKEQKTVSVLLVIDAYGPSYGGSKSTFNRQVAQFLKRHGATVHSTALQASDEDKRCATEDGVVLHLPVQDPGDKRTPSLEWLTYDHNARYPYITQDLKCIVGHTDITSHAANSIQEKRCQHAKLVLFNHDMPEETEYYKGTMKAMAAGRKMEDILEDAKNADAVFSLGRRIYDYFETTYMSLGDSKPRQHFLFLPRPSPVFEAISVRPGGGEKVVLSVGRVTEVDKLKGHDLVARSMGEVTEKIPNVRLRVRGIDEDDWEASKRILEENLHSGKIKPTLLPCGTQEDIAEDMKQAHLVLMPSRAEPFGLIGLEAIAAGIPVLISDKSGLADMIKDLKKRLLESKYWEESHQNLLRVCGLND